MSAGFDTAPTTSPKELLISTFPEFWDADDLHTLLGEKIVELNTICGVRDMSPVVANFARETKISASELHDRDKYITVQFSQEHTNAEQDSSMPSGYKINVREVVKDLSQAFQLLQRGGFDIGMVVGKKHIPKLIGPSHMTLDWDGNTLYPALRYTNGVDNLSAEDVKQVVEIIREGRSKIGKSAFDARTPLPR